MKLTDVIDFQLVHAFTRFCRVTFSKFVNNIRKQIDTSPQFRLSCV